MKRAIEMATEAVVLSAHLYRELALSALSLIPVGSASARGRRESI